MLQSVESEEKFKYFVPAQNMSGCLRPNTEYWFLTEDGLYEVLMQSRKPKAKEFKKEVKKILKSMEKMYLSWTVQTESRWIFSLMRMLLRQKTL